MVRKRKTKKFLCEYTHDGCNWGFEIHAYDWQDARERLRKMCFGRVIGTNVFTIPVLPIIGKLHTRIRQWGAK